MAETSGEHETLPRAELEALVELAGGHVTASDGDVVLLEAPVEAAVFIARRAALTHAILEHWWSGPADATIIAEGVSGVDLAGQRFAVRARRLRGAHASLSLHEVARIVGARLATRGVVDLRQPDVEARVLIGERAHAGRVLADVDRRSFEARHVKHRPVFAPVSLHPHYARALVNLARVLPGERVADPFCGTGGLLLEAGLVGARVLGSDLDPRMVEGTRDALAVHGVVGARLEARDVGELPEFAGGPLDVVLSDPPYGRSSTTNREAMDQLYARFVETAHAALRPGGRLAFICPSPELRELAAQRFRMLESHDQRVHRSMTRHWGVFVRD